jgi:hypothetical protein
MFVGFATETVSITYGRGGDIPGLSATEMGAVILQVDSALVERVLGERRNVRRKGRSNLVTALSLPYLANNLANSLS